METKTTKMMEGTTNNSMKKVIWKTKTKMKKIMKKMEVLMGWMKVAI